jgi:WD40 repeat protein
MAWPMSRSLCFSNFTWNFIFLYWLNSSTSILNLDGWVRQLPFCLFSSVPSVCFFPPNFASLYVYLFFQKELISGDQNGNIRVWDLAANSCSCELVSHFLIFQYHGTAVEREMQENNWCVGSNYSGARSWYCCKISDSHVGWEYGGCCK